MTIDEKRLVELCQQAAKEKNSKKRLALTKQIDRLLAAACEAWARTRAVTSEFLVVAQSLNNQFVQTGNCVGKCRSLFERSSVVSAELINSGADSCVRHVNPFGQRSVIGFNKCR